MLVTRRTGLSVNEADALGDALSKSLVSRGVWLRLDAPAARAAVARLGLKDAALCEGRKRCIAELASQLGVKWVISLSLAKLGGDLSIGFELINEGGTVVDKDSLVSVAGTTPGAEQLEPFAKKVRAVLGEAPAPVTPQTDTPTVATPPVVSLTPTPPPEPPLLISEPAPPPKSHGAALILGGGAVASLVAGVALVVSGVIDGATARRTTLVDGERRADFPASEVLARSNDADTRLGVGVGLGVLGLGLGAGAVFAW